MANTSFLLLFFFLIILYSTKAQQRTQTNITTGSSLTPGTGNSSWPSPSGLYSFGFYKQGRNNNTYSVGVFISGIPEKTVVWTANRDDPPVNQTVNLILTVDGRLILRSTQGEVSTIATNTQSATSAAMLDTGNFVLYNSDQDIIWQSFRSPTDTLLAGQRLLNGVDLVSSVSQTDHSSGFSRLAMQSDGNLVQYPLDGPWIPQNSYYASGTDGVGNNVTLDLDRAGNLYLWNGTTVLRNFSRSTGSLTERRIFLVRNDPDGIFRLYSYNLDQRNSSWSRLWSSNNNICVAIGRCGENGYCVMEDTEARCFCIPGFDFVDRNNWLDGCVRNSTVQSCRNNDGSVEYIMRELDNTSWEDTYFSRTITNTNKEDCKSACRQDCNCEAAMFNGGTCRMQKLPLRFGRRDLGDSNVALVKVESSELVVNQNPVNQPPEARNNGLRVEIVIIIISVTVFALVVFAVSGTIIYRNRVWAYKTLPQKGNDFGLRAFSYAELETVTNGFSDEIGSGSFGIVYKGAIALQDEEKVVAVKRLEKGLVDGEREFQTEMKAIGKTHHRNLVKLLGYCLEGSNRLLVYEYMSSGSLADVLFKNEMRQSWDVRVGVAKDIARGLLYLHEECELQIIHCDIKPQNILMDEFMSAKVADFGLAKLIKQDQTKTFTGIRGTKGYVAPEWHRNLPVTVKADVYSFGIVLLEILTCRKSVDMSLPEDEAILDEWVYECFANGELGKLVGDLEVVDHRKIDRMVKIGLWCIQDEPSIRPSMKKVLLMLEGTVDIPIPPCPTCFLSAI